MRLQLALLIMISVCSLSTLSMHLAAPVETGVQNKPVLSHKLQKAVIEKIPQQTTTDGLFDDIKGAQIVASLRQLSNKNIKKNQLPRDFGKNVILQENVHLAFGNDGYPTEESLQKLAQSKLLHAQNLADIYIKKVAGGAWTDRVYAVGLRALHRPIFFFKISRKAESSDSIIKLQKSMIGRVGINSRYADTKMLVQQNKLPIICWIEAFFSYRTPSNEQQRIEVIHAAHGVSISNLVTNGTREEIRQGGESFGFGLGLFQQVFMNYVDKNDAATWLTVAHSDLHANNSFFDITTSKTYWIDIDTMSFNKPITVDLNMIFEGVYSNDWRWKEFSFGALLKYIQSFNPLRRSAIKSFLKSRLSARLGEQLGLYNANDCVPLVAAILTSNEQEVEKILKSGISPFVGNAEGMMPFEWAVKLGNFKIAKLLMQYGVDIDTVSDNNLSFLSAAIEQRSMKDVEFLLSLGVDVNRADSSWFGGFMRYLETPLHRAVDVGDLKIVKALLSSKKVNINALNKGGQTALFRLVLRLKDEGVYTADDIEMAKMLVGAGIDVAIKDTKGRRVFDLLPDNMRDSFSFLKPSKPKASNPELVVQAVNVLQYARQEQILKTERLLNVVKGSASIVKDAAALGVGNRSVRLERTLDLFRRAVVAG